MRYRVAVAAALAAALAAGGARAHLTGQSQITGNTLTRIEPAPFNGGVVITFPQRNVAADPNAATLAYSRPECSATYQIPYIQASPNLTVTATATVPSGGGVKFVMTPSSGSPVVIYDMASPYSAAFTGLAKSDYTLDAYVVDSSQEVQNGHDQLTRVGIGDVYVAIGDSTTQGLQGVVYTQNPPWNNWLSAPTRTSDNREYPTCGLQISGGVVQWLNSGVYQSWLQDFGNKLTTDGGTPIFVYNHGIGSSTTASWITRLSHTNFTTPMGQLLPNKALVEVGINDSTTGGTPTWQTNMESIADTLNGTFGIPYSGIYVAEPGANTRTNWYPYIQNVITNKGVKPGPKLNSWFKSNPSQQHGDGLHPLSSGYTSKGQLWSEAITNPIPSIPTMGTTDNFNRADGSIGGAWTVVTGTYNIAGNAAQNGSASTPHIATITAGGASQSIAGTITKTGAATVGFALRVQDASNYYRVVHVSGGSNFAGIYKVVGGTATLLTSFTLNLGTAVSFTAQATAVQKTIVFSINGVSVLEAYDSTFTTGGVGITSVGPAQPKFDDVSAGVTTP